MGSERAKAQKAGRMKSLLIGILLIGSVAYADDETGDRRVEGGAIVYKAEASADSEAAAVFRAEALAVKALIIECSIANKEIRIKSRKTEKSVETDVDYNHQHHEWNRKPEKETTYTTRVEASIPITECEHSKVISSNPKEREKWENKRLVRDQHTFDRLTQQDLGLVEDDNKD